MHLNVRDDCSMAIEVGRAASEPRRVPSLCADAAVVGCGV
jgi:hypothetical protein